MDLIAMGWHHGDGGPPCGGFPILPLLLLIGGLIAAVVWWKRRGGGRPFGGGRPGRGSAPEAAGTPAEDLLADRFARGDIDDEEYWQRLSVIRESQGGKPRA